MEEHEKPVDIRDELKQTRHILSVQTQSIVALTQNLQKVLGRMPETQPIDEVMHASSTLIQHVNHWMEKCIMENRVPGPIPTFLRAQYCSNEDSICDMPAQVESQCKHSREACVFIDYAEDVQVSLKREEGEYRMNRDNQTYHIRIPSVGSLVHPYQRNIKTSRRRRVRMSSQSLPIEWSRVWTIPQIRDILGRINLSQYELTHVVDIRSQTLSIAFVQRLKSCKFSLMVWHGTHLENSLPILKNGFEPLACSPGAAMGPGIYASTSWDYAIQYAYPQTSEASSCPSWNPQDTTIDVSKWTGMDTKAHPGTGCPGANCGSVFLCMIAFDELTPQTCKDAYVTLSDKNKSRVMLEGSWMTTDGYPGHVNVVMRSAHSICPLFWIGFRHKRESERKSV